MVDINYKEAEYKVAAYIKSVKDKAFKWGKNDCYTFVYDILRILYPFNDLPDLKGKYSNSAEAGKLFEQYSWASELERCFVCEEVQVNELIEYDIVLVMQAGGIESANIVIGDKLYSIDITDRLTASDIKYLSVFQLDAQYIRLKKSLRRSS